MSSIEMNDAMRRREGPGAQTNEIDSRRHGALLIVATVPDRLVTAGAALGLQEVADHAPIDREQREVDSRGRRQIESQRRLVSEWIGHGRTRRERQRNRIVR